MPSAERLVNTLHHLGIHAFPETSSLASAEEEISAEQLQVGLAEHDDARLRRMLLHLFLYRPELSELVPDVLSGLNESGQATLKLFYTAAVFLQQVHEDQLKERVPHWRTLPDVFSEELDVPAAGKPLRTIGYLGETPPNAYGKSRQLGGFLSARSKAFDRSA